MSRLSPALVLVRVLTGLRTRHFLGAFLVLAAALGGLTVAFVWLGELAGGVAGVAGILLVVIAYLYAATLTLVLAALVAGRLLVGRLRGVGRLPRSIRSKLAI